MGIPIPLECRGKSQVIASFTQFWRLGFEFRSSSKTFVEKKNIENGCGYLAEIITAFFWVEIS